MKWNPINFGKHAGKTIPQVLLSEPSYFFWAEGEGVFAKASAQLALDAQICGRRARSILPHEDFAGCVIRNIFGHDGRFWGIQPVHPAEESNRDMSLSLDTPYINLSVPIKKGSVAYRDVAGYRNLLRNLKFYVFRDEKIRFTKKVADEFFADPTNFA